MKTRLFANGIDDARRGLREARRRKFWNIVSETFLPFFFFVFCPLVFGSLIYVTRCPQRTVDGYARSQAINLVESSKIFFILHDRWPMQLSELTDPPNGKPIMERIPQDSWGNEYRYRVRGGVHWDISVFSNGPDGIPHSNDDIVHSAPRREISLRAQRSRSKSAGGCDR